MSGRIAVGASGSGSNLRALAAAAQRGAVGGQIVLVFADRACPALDWATQQGIDTVLVPGGDDVTLAATLAAVEPDAVVLAGYLRLIGPAVLQAFRGRILNVHPSLLPAFPGLHGVRDALGSGVAVTGVTVHLVDETLDGGPIIAQEAVPVLPDDDEASLLERLHAVEHRLLPGAVAALLAGSLSVAPGARRTRLDATAADARVPVPRRALLSVSDKSGLADLGRGLVARGFELVSTGGTARALREAGLAVTDVAAVTGFPEMLDGRVKTLHPRVHAGLLADRRRADHREALIAAGIAPFELVVVNLYPFAEAARKPGLSFDDLVEEIDIGGPSMVRAAAKNHASVAIVTSPARYEAILAALDEHGEVPLGLRSALAVEAFRHTAAYDARIAAELPGRMSAAGVALPPEPGLPSSDDPYPPTLTISMAKVETLRYGENPHQPAARYRRTDREPRPDEGPFAAGEPPLQGKALSYNNVLDASAAAAVARLLRGPAVVIMKHTNPCGAAERTNLLDAWDAALAGDPSRRSAAWWPSAARWIARWPNASPPCSSRWSWPRPTTRLRARSWPPSRISASSSTRRSTPRRARAMAGRPMRPCPTTWVPCARPAVPCWSPRPTPSPTTRRPGPARRRVARPTASLPISTLPGGSSGAWCRTPSCSFVTGCSWGWAAGRSAGSMRAARQWTRPSGSRVMPARAARSRHRTRSSPSPTGPRRCWRPA